MRFLGSAQGLSALLVIFAAANLCACGGSSSSADSDVSGTTADAVDSTQVVQGQPGSSKVVQIASAEPQSASTSRQADAETIADANTTTGVEVTTFATSRVVPSVGVSTSQTGEVGTATISWLAPSENMDGSAITDLAGYNIYYGNSASALTNKITISTTGIQTYVIDNLDPGQWYFTVTAVNSNGVEGIPPDAVEVTI